MNYRKPKRLHYRIVQVAAWCAATFVFRRKIRRNEIKSVRGPYVVIANHEAALDFVNLIGLTRRPMSFVISSSMYNTLPMRGFAEKIGVIPKQQFQTSVRDLRSIKAVIDAGEPVVIYPAGLMSEDGLSTPIPAATYKFLKWLGVDVYAARVTGTYFVMPKWAKGLRPGRTEIDVYKLFSKEELADCCEEEIKARADAALLFDAYREQETLRGRYAKIRDLRGLENVLYCCPHCGGEYTVNVREKSTLYCTSCGFAETGDAYGFLHNTGGIGEEIRYVSDWSRKIYTELRDRISRKPETELHFKADIQTIDLRKKHYRPAGQGEITLNAKGFHVTGTVHGEAVSLDISCANVPTLPFSPGRYFEIQHGETSYRCLPEDGRIVMKVINMVKVFYELRKYAD